MGSSSLNEHDRGVIRSISDEGEVCSDMGRPKFKYSAEQSLWSACLHEAVRTYLGVGSGVNRQERTEAREWFAQVFGDDGFGAPPGSFEWICFILEIEAAPFRRKLVRLEEKTGGDGQVARKVLTELRQGISKRQVAGSPAA